MTSFDIRDILVRGSATGMRRFFSARNLGRYRKLASGSIGQEEQRQLLKELAAEVDAFRREGCRTAAEPPHFLGVNDDAQVDDEP